MHPRWKAQAQQGLRAGADRDALEKALNDYITAKRKLLRDRDRAASEIWIADVIAIYAEDVVPNHARAKETWARLGRLLDFFGVLRLSEHLALRLSSQLIAATWRSSNPPGRMSLARSDPLKLIRLSWAASWEGDYAVASPDGAPLNRDYRGGENGGATLPRRVGGGLELDLDDPGLRS